MRDSQIELERTLQSSTVADKDDLTLPDISDELTDHFDNGVLERVDSGGQAIQLAEKTRDFLIELIKPMSPSVVG